MAVGTNHTHPHQPGYVPQVDPSDTRDVGAGAEFGADLQALYVAGRVTMPDLAQTYVAISSGANGMRGRLAYLEQSTGSPAPLRDASRLLEHLAVATFKTAIAIRDSGEALVRIADDYVATDRAARDEFVRLNAMSDRLGEPTPHVATPPSPSEAVAPYVPEEPPTLTDVLGSVWGGITGGFHDLTTPDEPQADATHPAGGGRRG
jgi:hypothetical protein